jgi:hypothetical protein
VISKTHAQCANFNSFLAGSDIKAITADHWANSFVRRGRCPFDVVVVEEGSMLEAGLWNEVAKASMLVKQWIVLGDWHQFGAIANTYCGCVVEVQVKDSDLLYGLTQGCRWTPTENQRSDPVLFDFIKRVVASQDLGEMLEAARAQFPLREGPCKYSLCISHATRMRVNREVNRQERLTHPEAIKIQAVATKGDNSPQTMWVWPTQELIGAGGRTKKGLFYRVTALTPERITIDSIMGSLTMTHETAGRCLRLPHAITYAACQGLSLRQVRLLETDSQWFTWRHLYVGVSRCSSSETLQVS